MKRILSLIFLLMGSLYSFSQDTVPTPQNNPRLMGDIRLPAPVKSFWDDHEFLMAIIIVSFGIVVFFLEFLLVRLKIFDGQQGIKFMITTLVVICAIFLSVINLDAKDSAPVIGLLGTIVGYLLGSNSFANTEQNNMK